jgi:hypothetical protein
VATSLDTLIQRVRRFVRDYPIAQDALTGSINASVTTVPVGVGASFNPNGNQLIEIDYETLLVKSVSTNNLTTVRGFGGSIAASHASAAPVLINPAFLTVEIIDAINAAKDECFPLLYKPVLDTSLSADGLTYEYTVPNMPAGSPPIPYLSRVELLVNGDVAYRPIQDWSVRRGATPKIRFRSPPVTGTIRAHGFGPFPDLAVSTDTLDALWPANAERLLTLGAASRLLASGEAGRSRVDVGARDDREAANRAGNALNTSNSLYQRFLAELNAAAMPPMPKHVVPVL